MLTSRIFRPIFACRRAFSTARPDLRPGPVHLISWYEDNRELFSPPVCNKLMHKNQLMAMFVGGPNTRTDFHLDQGSEFFYQMRGNMELPIIEQGKRKLVSIKEGQVYLLPSRVPHSPQRPEEGSLGLVLERQRYEGSEKDGLRWYKDFDQCDEVLYQRYFYCDDLGRDLVPVVKAYMASEEFSTRKGLDNSVQHDDSPSPFEQDVTTKVPEPFYLQEWIEQHKSKLNAGAELNLFEGHPDGEWNVQIIGGKSSQSKVFDYETFFQQLKGNVTIEVTGKEEPVVLTEGSCFVVGAGIPYKAIRPEGSIGLVAANNPKGNK